MGSKITSSPKTRSPATAFRSRAPIVVDEHGLVSAKFFSRKLPTRPLRLPGLDTEFQVWEGWVDFVIPATADDRIAKMPGAIFTTMNSRKYMMRMLRRGLLRSPLKGLQCLKRSMGKLRAGPMGRRRKS